MSMALAHFAFGAAMTTLVVTFIVPTVWYPRTLALAGGGWAMVPDFHWVSPVATGTLREFHRSSVWTDVFWLHRSLDRFDPTDSATVAAALLGFLIAATALAERYGYRAPAPVRAAYESYLDRED